MDIAIARGIGWRSPKRMVNSVTPFFIVDDLAATIQFYESRLGFYVRHKGGDGQGADFCRNAPVRRPPADTNDGLRAFVITDNCGYVLRFGRPIDEPR